jgi:hypothetical protein
MVFRGTICRVEEYHVWERIIIDVGKGETKVGLRANEILLYRKFFLATKHDLEISSQ